MQPNAYFVDFNHTDNCHKSGKIIITTRNVAHTTETKELSPFKPRFFEYNTEKEWIENHLNLVKWYTNNQSKLLKPFLCCNYSKDHSTKDDAAYQVIFFDKEKKQRNLNFHLLENKVTKTLRFRRYDMK